MHFNDNELSEKLTKKIIFSHFLKTKSKHFELNF